MLTVITLQDEDGNFPEVKPSGASTVGPSQATPIQLGRPTTNVNTTSNYSFGRNSYSTDTTYQVWVPSRKRKIYASNLALLIIVACARQGALR